MFIYVILTFKLLNNGLFVSKKRLAKIYVPKTYAVLTTYNVLID